MKKINEFLEAILTHSDVSYLHNNIIDVEYEDISEEKSIFYAD